MTDFVQLQEDLTALLKSADTLALVNVVQYRKLRLSAEVDASVVYQQPRSGVLAGVGILVEMPEVSTAHANLPGPEFACKLPFLVIEEPNVNLTPGMGTELSAEEVAQRVVELLHGYGGGNWGGNLYASGPVITSAPDVPEGLLGYRVVLNLRLVRTQLARVATPAPSAGVDNTTTITCATSGAAIYYTLDGTFPGPGNAAAILYTAPFVPTVGQELRCAAFKAGLLPSYAVHATVTAP